MLYMSWTKKHIQIIIVNQYFDMVNIFQIIAKYFDQLQHAVFVVFWYIYVLYIVIINNEY